MPVARLALAGAVAAAALGLTGCVAQPEPANDNPNDRPGNMPQTQPTIIRTPVQVDEAPATVPLPGVTGGPQGEPQTDVTFSPGPEGEQAETSQHGPDGT